MIISENTTNVNREALANELRRLVTQKDDVLTRSIQRAEKASTALEKEYFVNRESLHEPVTV